MHTRPTTGLLRRPKQVWTPRGDRGNTCRHRVPRGRERTLTSTGTQGVERRRLRRSGRKGRDSEPLSRTPGSGIVGTRSSASILQTGQVGRRPRVCREGPVLDPHRTRERGRDRTSRKRNGTYDTVRRA